MFAFSGFGGRPARTATPKLTAADAVRMAQKGEITVIDVRGHDEVARSGKAKGAIHIPLMMIPNKADPRHPEFHPELSTDKPVAVYCASGARSGMAAQMLERFGFPAVHNIGGLGDWVSAGGPVSQ